MKKRVSLNNNDLNKYRRSYRDLNKLKILSNTDVLAERVLQNSIRRSSNELYQSNGLINIIDCKIVRAQNKEYIEKLTSLVTEQDHLDSEMKLYKTKIDHLRSQIERVDVELEKYSTLNIRYNDSKTIEILENRLLNNNQKVNDLKLNGIKLKTVVSDLLLMRRRFQMSRNNIIANLMKKKQEMNELVDHYTIAFSNGMKICSDLEICRTKSAKELKDHLQEMRQLIRAAESNDILRDFMITKATPIQLNSDAVPQREILMQNYESQSKICEDQLSQVPDTTSDDLKYKRRQIFSLYLYENEITDNIEDLEKGVTALQSDIASAQTGIQHRKQKEEHLEVLHTSLDKHGEKVKDQNERVVELDSVLRKYLEKIQGIYTMLGCDTDFGFEGTEMVDEFNIDEVLQIIELRMRQVMYSVYCWQEQNATDTEKSLVHGTAIKKPREIPEIELINPCPECSQVEANANPEAESLMDIDAKSNKIRENITKHTMMSKMHHIEDCPKPGSKAVLAKAV